MARGAFTSEEISQAYLDRVEEIDRNGPTLRAIIEVNPDALEIASAMDRERAQGRIRGPLHGIPVVIKDNIDTADRMQTTAGSLALVGATVSADAPVAAKLRAAGETGVLAMVGDSTNATRDGRSPSERDVAKTLAELVRTARGRVAVTTFASNVARIPSPVVVASRPR